jgi:hypothetical protein
VTTASDNLGLPAQVVRLLAERAAADAHVAELERANESLRRDILHQSNELIHLRRTLGHETARCDAMQAEMMKRNAVAVRHAGQEEQ